MDATLRWKRRRTSHTRNWIIWTSSSSTRLTYKNPYHNLPKTIQHLFGKNHNQRPSTIWDQSSGVHLHYFDNSKETVLNVDASSKGLWCSDLAGRQADCIRIQTTNYLWEKVCKHRKRAACNRLGRTKISHIRILAESYCRDRSQTMESIFRKSLNDGPPRATKNGIETYQV